MKRITNWLDGRTAAIALHGASIRGLRNHPHYLDRNWAWATVNRWQVVEKILWPDLPAVDRPLGLVLMTSETEMEKVGSTLVMFLNRNESNLVVTTLASLNANPAVEHILTECHRGRVVLVRRPPLVATEHLDGTAALNSAMLLAMTLVRAGARRLLFFGLDGAEPGEVVQARQKETYADQSIFRDSSRDTQIARDTWVMNESANALLTQAMDQTGARIEVYNASPATYITAFPVISHAQAVEIP